MGGARGAGTSLVAVGSQELHERRKRGSVRMIEREPSVHRAAAGSHPSDLRDDYERIPEIRRVDFQRDDATWFGPLRDRYARAPESQIDQPGGSSAGLARYGDGQGERPASEGAEMALRGHGPRPYHGEKPKKRLVSGRFGGRQSP